MKFQALAAPDPCKGFPEIRAEARGVAKRRIENRFHVASRNVYPRCENSLASLGCTACLGEESNPPNHTNGAQLRGRCGGARIVPEFAKPEGSDARSAPRRWSAGSSRPVVSRDRRGDCIPGGVEGFGREAGARRQ